MKKFWLFLLGLMMPLSAHAALIKYSFTGTFVGAESSGHGSISNDPFANSYAGFVTIDDTSYSSTASTENYRIVDYQLVGNGTTLTRADEATSNPSLTLTRSAGSSSGTLRFILRPIKDIAPFTPGVERMFYSLYLSGTGVTLGNRVYDLSSFQSGTTNASANDDSGDAGQSRSTGMVSSFSSAYVSAAPEPEAWLMMICGFGFIGMALRRIVRTTAIASGRTGLALNAVS